MKKLFGLLLGWLFIFSSPSFCFTLSDFDEPTFSQADNPVRSVAIVCSPEFAVDVILIRSLPDDSPGCSIEPVIEHFPISIKTSTTYSFEGYLNLPLHNPNGYSGDVYQGERAYLVKV